jgi:3-isopropylmalate/(R)-2-methylmalate dehydratase small subunit
MGAAGVQVVVAESFARIFFRNCVATGELYPYDAAERLCDKVQTGDIATLDFDADTLTVGGTTYSLKPLGEVRPVIDAGGIFNYARQTGMIAAKG